MEIKIIGGGAAGLISALYLRRMDRANITIFEKQDRDEYEATPCGEAISLEKINKLKSGTGFDSRPYISKKVEGIKVIYPNGKFNYLYQKGGVLDRTEWQKGMIDLLEDDISIKFGTEINSPDEINYDYLVGAEGPTSFIREEIGGKIDAVPTVQYRMKLDEDVEYLRFYNSGNFDHGYGWVFPKKGGMVNVGCEGNFNELDKFMDEFGIEGEIKRRETYPIGVGGNKFQEDDIYLIGCSGGLTNRVSGGGLAPIIYCSDFLRESIVNGESYDKKIRESPLNPRYWDRFDEKLYCEGGLFKDPELLCKLGNITDKQDIRDLSLVSRIRILFNLEILRNIDDLKEGFSKITKYSW